MKHTKNTKSKRPQNIATKEMIKSPTKKVKMNKKLRSTLMEEFPEFDAILAFVERNNLPTYPCSILSWPQKGGHAHVIGFSNAALNVFLVIARAWTEYAENAGAGNVADLKLHRKGPEVSIRVKGHKLIAFTRMTAADLKFFQETEEYRNEYRHFDQAVDFVKHHKLPTCECLVFARPDGGGTTYPRENTASAVQVAVAICSAWDEYSSDFFDTYEDDQLMDLLKVFRDGKTVIVHVEEWHLIWFTPV